MKTDVKQSHFSTIRISSPEHAVFQWNSFHLFGGNYAIPCDASVPTAMDMEHWAPPALEGQAT